MWLGGLRRLFIALTTARVRERVKGGCVLPPLVAKIGGVRSWVWRNLRPCCGRGKERMGGAAGPPEGASYSNGIGAVYIFNLIVGAGALSLPNAFAQAGYLSGTLLLLGELKKLFLFASA